MRPENSIPPTIDSAETSSPSQTPTVTVTEMALRALLAAASQAGDDCLRLEVDSDFVHDLFFGAPTGEDVEVALGELSIHLDAASARRAHGVRIDFVPGSGGGFRLDNPNAPPAVKALSPAALRDLLDRREITLFDVRPAGERALASIPEAIGLDTGGGDVLLRMERDAPIALLCHHGVRSRRAALQLLREGYRNLYNVEGGIDLWSQTVDPRVPRY